MGKCPEDRSQTLVNFRRKHSDSKTADSMGPRLRPLTDKGDPTALDGAVAAESEIFQAAGFILVV